MAVASACYPPTYATPVIGVDFSTGGSFNSTTDDLVIGDGITISDWSIAGGGKITGDGNGNTGRASAPVGKFNGPSLANGTPPALGSAPPTQGIHSFTITIDSSTTINLTDVRFDFSRATEGSAQRWLAFRTSLDTGLLYSANGPARPTFTSVGLALTDTKYQGLTDTTVTFYWYSGGQGSGDCDIDSIVVEAAVAAANPPTVTNSAATHVEATSATLNGIVTDTGGAAPLITIFYGTTDGGTTPGNWTSSVDLGNETASFVTDVTGLSPSSNYFFRSYAENSAGTDWAPSSETFTTNAIFPSSIDNSPASNVRGTSARVAGEVTNTGGSPPVVTLYWGDNDGGTSTDAWDNLITLGAQNGSFETNLANLNSLTTYYFRSLAINGGGQVWAAPTEAFTTLEVRDLVINEFLAANDGGLSNNQNAWFPIANQVSGRTDDWIEIANRSSGPLPLDGWFLTDESANLTRWAFPAGTTVPQNGFIIVYASGNGIPDANGNLHTNFKLSKGGDYLALVDPMFAVASEFASGGMNYPTQDDDISYGLHPVSELPVYFESPTPGDDNDTNGQARVADTKFSLKRGYYQTAINVEITTATLGATIYYTTDGTFPIDELGNPGASAQTYSIPIALNRTTAIRAAAVKVGLVPTNVDCNSYFLLDIDGAASNGIDTSGLNLPFLQQSQPAGWGNLTSGDYDMDSEVSQETTTATGHATSTAKTMLEGMRDIPTISIVMNRDDFSGSNGIYTNSGNKGFAWERACSAEFIPAETDTRSDWQENCGLRVQGGASRNPSSSPKHSLSFRFRERYGVNKLKEPLFPGSAVDEYNVIALRAGYNNSWIHRDSGQRGRGSMVRDQWMRQSMLDMGHSAAGEGFMAHVFVNGLYWGLHNICERGDASHYAGHNGGDADLLDARNGSQYTDGNSTAWNQISGVVNSADWQNIQQVININQYIDYQLINRYGSNQDLKTSGNWRAAGGGPFPSGMPEQMAPWDLYSWDGERCLESQNSSSIPLDPMGVRGILESNDEYRIRLADRLQKHFYGNGALTPTKTAARWERYVTDIDRAIIAESARWGDHRRATPYTRDAEWLTEQNRLNTSYFPVRTNNVLNNLTLLTLDAPTYLVGGSSQVEGLIPLGSTLTVTGSTTIYYTTDGSDPRLDGGAISPNATAVNSGGTIPISAGAIVKARVRSGTSWSAVTDGTYFVGPIADSTNIVISEIMYNPVGMDENTEFIELLNLNDSHSIDLSLSTFAGIDYTFPLGESLAPGERIVIVKDLIAFATVYNTADMRIAPGDYRSRLSNDGEELAFINGLGADAQRFTYNDVDPWPRAADGDGFTLTLIAPEISPLHSLASNWRSSTALNGTPGGSDAETFLGDPMADADGDGLNALLEYALGSTAGDAGPSPEARATLGTGTFDDGNGGTTEFLTFSYRRNLGADDILYQVQLSSDLDNWADTGSEYVTSVSNEDGTETVTIRSVTPIADLPKKFIRLKINLP